MHDAEDEFQAAFLILARKAGTVRRRDAVGPYLNAVAFRVAANLRRRPARCRRCEGRVPAQERGPRMDAAGESFELGAILHEEIARLPARFQRVSVPALPERFSLQRVAT
jgi:RNA polymerase sigma-70 factor (ECF subfamily)